MKIMRISNLTFLFLTIALIFGCSEDCDNLPCDCNTDETALDMSEFELIRINQENVIVQIEIDDEETDLVTELGFIWSNGKDSVTIENADDLLIAEEVTEDNLYQLDGLQTKTEYLVRAYAKTDNLTYYSQQISFITIDKDGTKGTLEDIDGNVYETIIYGGDEWMIENLKTTKYSDGTAIKTNISDEEWGTISYGAYGFYPHEKIDGFESDAEIINAYGLMYNWYAVNEEKQLAPTGWHIATDEEWRRLEMALGMSESDSKDNDVRGTDQGAKMKIVATAPISDHPRWDSGNESTNSSGFSVVPGGARYPANGNYGYVGFLVNFWTATEVSTGDSWIRSFTFHENGVGRNIADKNYGFYVRCVKDNL